MTGVIWSMTATEALYYALGVALLPRSPRALRCAAVEAAQAPTAGAPAAA